MFPGEIEFTRTPWAASSTASALVNAVIAPLVATYVVAWSWPITPDQAGHVDDVAARLPEVRQGTPAGHEHAHHVQLEERAEVAA